MKKTLFATIALAISVVGATDTTSVPAQAPAFGTAEPSPESQDAPNPVDELTQAIYVHPLMVQATLGNDSVPFFLPITYERELGHGKSLAIQPTFIFGNIATPLQGEPKISAVGLKAMLAYHIFFNGVRAKGFYVGPALEALYLHASRAAFQDSYGDSYPVATADEVGAGVLGFVGWRGKWRRWTMFVDLGAGGQLVHVSGNSGYSISARGLAIDADLGFGIPF
jgi:hypothetical protein